jgi:hypothetical protein
LGAILTVAKEREFRMSRTAWTWFVIGALALLSAIPAVAVEKLTLRVNDAIAVPGGTAAIVLRTYASKPIEQGQLCLEAKPTTPDSSGPAKIARSAEVFSDNQDTAITFTADLTQAVQTFVVQFSSPTATINSSDGPLAVLLVDLDETLTPGQTFDLTIDLQNTFLIDENGNPIEIRPRAGKLTIRDPSDPVIISAHAEDVAPGDVAKLSLLTNEHLPLASGRVGFAYDSAIAAGPPTVAVDPRYGQVLFSLDISIPGLAIVDFVSPDGSFNSIPGNVIDLYVPTLETIPVGTQSPISLDASVFLIGTTGQSLSLSLENNELNFVSTPSETPGHVINLRLNKGILGTVELDWSEECGDPDGFSVYRGDLAHGFASLTPEPSGCNLFDGSAVLSMGAAAGELFLIVPHRAGLAGSYGVSSGQVPREPIVGACYPPDPEMTTTVCRPAQP